MTKVRNTPRRKRLEKQVRLVQARQWLEHNKAQSNLIRRYANWYGVSRLCAVLELIQLGVTFETDVVSREKHMEIENAELRKRRKVARETKSEPPIEFDFYWAGMADEDLDDSGTAEDPQRLEELEGSENLPF